MLYAILKAPFARSLFLSSATRLARPAVARPALFLEARRTFLTTALVLKEAAEKPKKVKAKKDPVTKTKTVKKDKKVVATKIKKEKKVKVVAKEPRLRKMDMKLPFKRPASAWQSFYFKYVDEHKQPGDIFAAHAHAASLAWKSLTEEEKQKYAAPKEEREEYRRKAKEFRATDPTYRKAVKKLRKPRRSAPFLGAYNAFVKLNFNKDSPLTFVEQGAELGKRWRELSDEQKAEFKKLGAEMTPRSQQESAEAEK